jgi:hypothetical protein
MTSGKPQVSTLKFKLKAGKKNNVRDGWTLSIKEIIGNNNSIGEAVP